jgi:hypothetical protein
LNSGQKQVLQTAAAVLSEFSYFPLSLGPEDIKVHDKELKDNRA